MIESISLLKRTAPSTETKMWNKRVTAIMILRVDESHTRNHYLIGLPGEDLSDCSKGVIKNDLLKIGLEVSVP
jgi:hypothetical protein